MIMRDHPGWIVTRVGAARVMRSGPSTWLLACVGHLYGIEMTVVDGPRDGLAPEVIRVDRPLSPGSEIGAALASAIPSWRVRNTDLWDAIGTTILSQIIGAEQARAIYQRFCESSGDPVDTPYGVMYLFPDPERLLRLPSRTFNALKMSFTRALLRTAATAYLKHGDAWSRFGPAALVAALRSVPGIGSWTAGVAAADYTGDFSVYPYTDRTVRAYARRAAPNTMWPAGDAAFRSHWRTLAGDGVSGLTQLVLAWGQARLQPTDSEDAGPLHCGEIPEPVDLLDVLRAHHVSEREGGQTRLRPAPTGTAVAQTASTHLR
jgi:DNA-3-methyladenine glycosylase II